MPRSRRSPVRRQAPRNARRSRRIAAPKARRHAARAGTPRRTGAAGARTGTVRGRTRKPPRRMLPQRSASERRARADQLFGDLARQLEQRNGHTEGPDAR